MIVVARFQGGPLDTGRRVLSKATRIYRVAKRPNAKVTKADPVQDLRAGIPTGTYRMVAAFGTPGVNHAVYEWQGWDGDHERKDKENQ